MTEMIHRSISLDSPRIERSHWWNTIDRAAISAVLILFSIGLLLSMASTSGLTERLDLPSFYFVVRQLFFGFVALTVMILFSMLTPTYVRRLGVLGFFCATIALFSLPLIGTDFGKGSVRWIDFGVLTVQPSEFLKPGFAIMMAWLITAGRAPNGPPGALIALGFASILIFTLALQPDYGQAAILVTCFFVIMIVGGFNPLYLIGIGAFLALGAQFAYQNSEHVAGRINSFLSQEIDPHTQIGFAANAISNGGLFGAGVGEGTVKYSLPDAHTDFIMAVAAEEYGVILCWAIILLYAFLVVRSLIRLTCTTDMFTRLAGLGLVTLIGVQSMINLGVAARIFPTKGMTLPLISYGGSSLLAIGITLGFLLALTRTRSNAESYSRGLFE